jgi:hypothetical protein
MSIRLKSMTLVSNLEIVVLRTNQQTGTVNLLEVVGRAGFEPATFRLSVERSSRAELPALFLATSNLMPSQLIRIFVNLLIATCHCCL